MRKGPDRRDHAIRTATLYSIVRIEVEVEP